MMKRNFINILIESTKLGIIVKEKLENIKMELNISSSRDIAKLNLK
jgi:hypothetical protein